MDQAPTRTTGASPSKSVREPEEAMRMARTTPGRRVLVSEGHAKFGARVKANDIRCGKRSGWAPYQGEVQTSALQQPDGSYNVYVYVEPETSTETD